MMKNERTVMRLSARLAAVSSLALVASTALGSLPVTPPLCPPGGEIQDYGTGCSRNPKPPPDFATALVGGGWGTGTTKLSAAERTPLFPAAAPAPHPLQAHFTHPPPSPPPPPPAH